MLILCSLPRVCGDNFRKDISQSMKSQERLSAAHSFFYVCVCVLLCSDVFPPSWFLLDCALALAVAYKIHSAAPSVFRFQRNTLRQNTSAWSKQRDWSLQRSASLSVNEILAECSADNAASYRQMLCISTPPGWNKNTKALKNNSSFDLMTPFKAKYLIVFEFSCVNGDPSFSFVCLFVVVCLVPPYEKGGTSPAWGHDGESEKPPQGTQSQLQWRFPSKPVGV